MSESSVSSLHFSFPFNNFWRDVLISFKFCRTLYHYKIQIKFDILVIIRQILALNFCCSFPLNNFWRDALISLTLCRILYQCKTQVKFDIDIDNHPPNFGGVMVLYRLSFYWCVDIGFRSITFAGMHWFYWKFAEGYIIVKYRSILIFVIIRKILAEIWPFFDLFFCFCVDISFHSITFAGMHWFYWKFAEGYIIVKYRSSSILVFICKILGKFWPFFYLVAFRDRSDYKDQCFFPCFILNGWRFKQATYLILGILVWGNIFSIFHVFVVIPVLLLSHPNE